MATVSFFFPPIAFAVILTAAVGLSFALSRLSLRRKGAPAGLTKPYACGEENPDQIVQPDYAQFLPFAVFFTILHVVALVVATVPAQTGATFLISVIYILGAIIGLTILYRK